jgi:hypothetical protein
MGVHESVKNSESSGLTANSSIEDRRILPGRGMAGMTEKIKSVSIQIGDDKCEYAEKRLLTEKGNESFVPIYFQNEDASMKKIKECTKNIKECIDKIKAKTLNGIPPYFLSQCSALVVEFLGSIDGSIDKSILMEKVEGEVLHDLFGSRIFTLKFFGMETESTQL